MVPSHHTSLPRRDWFTWAGSGLGGVALAGLWQRGSSLPRRVRAPR